MTQVQITHSCGHKQIDMVYGANHSVRQQRSKWLSDMPCRICQGEIYRKQDFEDGYSLLLGSKAQNAWAYQIRHDAINELKRYILVFSSNSTDEYIAKELELHRLALELVNEKGTARWWIDHRDSPHNDLLNEVKKVTTER